MSTLVLGVDLGGSNVRVLLADLCGHALSEIAAPTAQADGGAVVAQIAELARELARGAEVAWSQIGAMAVGVAGVVQLDGSGLALAPNLPLLAELDVAAALERELALPVLIDNDVNMATLAEQRHGYGMGVSDFVFIAVGTGVGMGIVASGSLQRGATGAAGEIGYLPLGRDPFERVDQTHGPLEELVGGVGVARRYAELSGAPPATVSTLDVYGRRAAGDPRARTVLDDQARAMALAVVSALSMLDPALVVLGGGIGSREDFVADVREHVGRLTPRSATIEASRLGERAGLVGAAELARAHVDGRAPQAAGQLAGPEGEQ